jgi:hypothetical protein
MLTPDVEARDQEARGRVRIAVAEGELARLLQQVVEAVERAVLVDDQQRPIARRAVAGGGLHEDLALGAVDRLHGRSVAEPGDLHLVEAHALDHAGIVGGEEGVDLPAGLLRHVGQERLEHVLQVGARLGRDDAEVDLLQIGGMGGASQRDGRGGGKECATKHGFSLLLV